MVENRTRERLTGAAILVALIVLLVPELLSGPRRAAPQLSAVVDEAPIRSYTLSLAEGPGAVTPTAERPAEIRTTADRAYRDPVDGTQTDPAPADRSGANRAAVQTDGAPVAADRGTVAADGARIAADRPSVAVPRAQVPVDRAARVGVDSVARTRLQTRSHLAAHSAPPHEAARRKGAEPGESAVRGWAVQVGSFGSRENADRLARRLKLKGYGTFVSESSSRGHTWYRVRVGPQHDRAAADAVAARLRAAGLHGAVAQPR